MVEHRGHECGVSVSRDSLVAMVEVVIVIVEPERQALEDTGWELGRGQTPLLFGVALEEGLVQVSPHHAEGLFLEVLWYWNVFGECTDVVLCLGGAHGSTEELVHGVEVDREGVDLSIDGGLDPTDVGHHLSVLVHEVPDLFVIGVKDVGAVLMQHDSCAVVSLGMAVPADMVPLVDDETGDACFGELARDDHSREPRSYDQYLFHSSY